MPAISKRLGIFIPLVLVMKTWDLVTFPIYWVVQQPLKTRRKFNKLRSTLVKYSDDTLLVVPPPANNKTAEAIEKVHSHGNLNTMFDWIWEKFSEFWP